MVTVIVFTIASISSWAQIPRFKKIQVNSELNERQVFVLEQDSLGFLWLGTNQGIFRFDGVKSTEIPVPDSLKAVRTTSLFIGKESIHFGLENGFLISVNTRSMVTVQVAQLSQSEITCITEDHEGRIWAGTNGSGVTTLHQGILKVYTSAEGLADDYVHDVACIHHQVAIATDLGLSICQVEGERFIHKNYSQSEGLTDNMVMSLMNNGDKNLIMGMENGSVCNLNLDNNRIDEFTKFNEGDISPITKILKLDENILVLTENDGAFVLNWHDRFSFQQFQLSEEGKAARKHKDAIVDLEGNLILAFGDNYITIADFRLQYIRTHDDQSFADASCVIADSEGNIWFANEEGIFRHRGEFAAGQSIEQFYQRKKDESNIISLCEGNDDDIWFGTFGHGLGRIDIKTKKTTRFNHNNGLINDNVLGLALQGNTLWLATLGGAGKLHTDGDKTVFIEFDATSPLRTNFIYTVFVDSKDRVWFGTDGNGLVKYENETFEFFIEKHLDAGKSITSITEDAHGNIWFLTTDRGLQWTDSQTLNSVNLNSKNEKVEAFAIHSDAFGNVVALTSAGLAIMNNHNRNISFIRTGFDIVSNYLNVITKDISGHMWLCSQEAMIRYNDFNLGKDLKPRTYIDGIEVMLQPADTSRHEFRHNENHLTFDITSIWFQSPESVSYQYRLIGYDTNWVTTHDRKVIFSQLSPGQYTFELRSSAHEFWDDADIAKFSFKILLPYYRKVWFILLCLLSAVVLVSVIIRFRLKSIRRNEALAREKVQSQFDTLRNQVNPHFLFNSFNTLNSIIAQDQNAAINYVEKLSDYFRIVLEQRDKDVITVKEELALVRNYLYLQQQRFGQNLIFNIQISNETGSTLIPPLTIQILAENAIKHNVISKSRPLTLNIYEEDDSIIISNNLQLKLTREHSTGIGLDNIRHRYRILFKREIIIHETPEDFSVKLPVIGNKKSEI